jgi:hypothetical protein
MGSKIDDVMRNAAAVVGGNEYIAERARGAGAVRVKEIPSVVDLERTYRLYPGSCEEVVDDLGLGPDLVR